MGIGVGMLYGYVDDDDDELGLELELRLVTLDVVSSGLQHIFFLSHTRGRKFLDIYKTALFAILL